MGDMAVIPAWVVQPPMQVADCLRISYTRAKQGAPGMVVATTASVNWVTGGQEAPMSGLPFEPTEAEARAEWFLAGSFGRPLDSAWFEQLGVAPRTAALMTREWADGCGLALGWLLGIHPRPPIELPRRNPDGTTPTAEQLYREAVEAKPYSSWLPEQRNAARSEAAGLAGRYRRLAELADAAG